MNTNKNCISMYTKRCLPFLINVIEKPYDLLLFGYCDSMHSKQIKRETEIQTFMYHINLCVHLFFRMHAAIVHESYLILYKFFCSSSPSSSLCCIYCSYCTLWVLPSIYREKKQMYRHIQNYMVYALFNLLLMHAIR